MICDVTNREHRHTHTYSLIPPSCCWFTQTLQAPQVSFFDAWCEEFCSLVLCNTQSHNRTISLFHRRILKLTYGHNTILTPSRWVSSHWYSVRRYPKALSKAASLAYLWRQLHNYQQEFELSVDKGQQQLPTLHRSVLVDPGTTGLSRPYPSCSHM